MKYEVRYETWEDEEQTFTYRQFATLDEALKYYENKKSAEEVEGVRLSLIMNEYSRFKPKEKEVLSVYC